MEQALFLLQNLTAFFSVAFSHHGRHLLAALPSPPLHPAVQPPLLLALHAVSKALHLPELAAVLHGVVCQDGSSLRPAQHRPADGGAPTDGQLHHHAEAPRLRQHVQPGESSVFFSLQAILDLPLA